MPEIQNDGISHLREGNKVKPGALPGPLQLYAFMSNIKSRCKPTHYFDK